MLNWSYKMQLDLTQDMIYDLQRYYQSQLTRTRLSIKKRGASKSDLEPLYSKLDLLTKEMNRLKMKFKYNTEGRRNANWYN